MSEVAGASKSMRSSIKIIKSITSVDHVASASPRADYDAHLDALIKKAYVEGFKKAHRLLRENHNNGSKVRKHLRHSASIPAVDGKQKFNILSKIKEN